MVRGLAAAAVHGVLRAKVTQPASAATWDRYCSRAACAQIELARSQSRQQSHPRRERYRQSHRDSPPTATMSVLRAGATSGCIMFAADILAQCVNTGLFRKARYDVRFGSSRYY